MLNGSVSPSIFNEVIPMDFSNGLPFIKVEIQGQEYRFLFDTGAPNTISAELAKKLDYKVVKTVNINDSQGNSRKQVSVKLDEIKIGEVTFENMGAVIVDHNKVFALKCFNFDGIIGSNLIHSAVWEIDYEREKIRFSNDRSAFDVPDDALVLPIKPKWAQRKPLVEVDAGGISFNEVTFDTGASGAFGLSVGKSKVDLDSLTYFEIKGSISTGVYGDGGESLIRYGFVDTLRVGNVEFYDQFVGFENKGSATLGNKFFDGYRMIIDLTAREVFLIETSGFDNKEFKSFGFIPKFKDQKMFVNALIQGSPADSLGIEIGSQILEINGVDYQEISDADACSFRLDNPLETVDEIQLKFVLDSIEVEGSLRRQNFARKKIKL